MLTDEVIKNNWKIVVIIPIIIICISLLIWVVIITPPSKTLTICDESHRETYTYLVPVHVGDSTIMSPRIGVKTVCDKSHVEPNPAYDKWLRDHPNG